MSMYQLTHSYDGKNFVSQTYFKNCIYNLLQKWLVWMPFGMISWAEGIFVITKCIDLGSEHFSLKNAPSMVCKC